MKKKKNKQKLILVGHVYDFRMCFKAAFDL